MVTGPLELTGTMRVPCGVALKGPPEYAVPVSSTGETLNGKPGTTAPSGESRGVAVSLLVLGREVQCHWPDVEPVTLVNVLIIGVDRGIKPVAGGVVLDSRKSHDKLGIRIPLQGHIGIGDGCLVAARLATCNSRPQFDECPFTIPSNRKTIN
jgi:hypothetical protein